MMSGNMGFTDLWQQYWPWLCLGQYCCLTSIKLHVALSTGPYLYNINTTFSLNNISYLGVLGLTCIHQLPEVHMMCVIFCKCI